MAAEDGRGALAFGVLGSLEVRRDGQRLAIRGRKQRALLTLLLLHANQPVRAEWLIDQLWGERPPATAAKALQVYVSQLRKLLEPSRTAGGPAERLVSTPTGYMLRLDEQELDLKRFDRLRMQGRSALAGGRPDDAAGHLAAALALWRGEALADVADAPFASTETARLADLRISAVEERIDADLQLGRHNDLVGELEALVAEHPLRETLSERLMLALYRGGRQADALDRFQQARRTLTEELGIEPGKGLRELQHAILRQDPGLELPDEPLPEQSVFVGRDAELTELRTALAASFAGRGSLFLVSGEPGIGKTRLAEELTGDARRRGALVLVGRCWEAGGAPAYWPWAQALREYIRTADAGTLRDQLGAGAAEVAQLIPELRQQLPDLPEPVTTDPDGARFRQFDAVAVFLRAVSAARPMVVVLDDLHAADPASLLLLQFVSRELRTSGLLIIGAFRELDPAAAPALTATVAELARESVTRRLTLRGLGAPEIADFVDATAPSVASPAVLEALREETAGNPLFVNEIVRLLALEGAAVQPDGSLRIAIPQTVREAIARRLEHLSDGCNRALAHASVLGREFPLDTLGHAAGLAHDELVDRVDEAVLARLLSEVPNVPGRFRFTHMLIRDTLYERLTPARRVLLHRRVMQALESDGSDSQLAELAHHAVAGSDFDRAVRYARRAGDEALALSAYEEAARLYETALEALALARAGEPSARCELLLAFGDAQAGAGRQAGAKGAFLEAADLARQLGLRHELARAAAGYGGRLAWARTATDDQLVPLLEEGIAAVGDDVELRARLLARLAGALRDEHSRDRRDALSREAVELARRSRNPAALAHALTGRWGAIVAPDTLDECIEIADELCQVAAGLHDLERLAIGHGIEVTSHAMAGNIREADTHRAAASEIAQELGQPGQLWLAAGTHAAFALAAGRLEEGEQLAAEAILLGERAQPEMAVPVNRLQRYTLADFRGRLADVEAQIAGLVAAWPSRPMFRCVLTLIHARVGRQAEATRALDELSEGDFAALPFDQEWLFGMSLLAEAAALLNHASGRALYELLLPWSALNAADPAEGMRGSVSRYLGLLAGAEGREADAERHFEDALVRNEEMGAEPWLARTQEDFARLLSSRDSDRARSLEASARASYRRLGMVGWK